MDSVETNNAFNENHVSIEMQEFSKNDFRQLSELILKTKSECGGEEGYTQNLNTIRNIFNKNANSIIEKHINGKNILHVIATQRKFFCAS